MTLLLTAGVSPFAVQRILRHTDPKMTTEVYGHVASEMLEWRALLDSNQWPSASETDALSN